LETAHSDSDATSASPDFIISNAILAGTGFLVISNDFDIFT
jgi:hypothetical protein